MSSMENLNLVLLTIDCWRGDHLGATGAAPSPTRHLDQLAAEGTIFEQAITCGGWTRPAMMALFSSVYASRHHGGSLHELSPELPLLSELLQAQGYETAGFTTNPVCGRSGGFERGFDTFADLMMPTEPLPELPRWFKYMRPRWRRRVASSPLLHRLMQLLGRDEHRLPPEVNVSAKQLTDEVLSWLTNSRQKPFFLWAHYMDIHWPYRGSRREVSPHEVAQMWQDRFIMSKVNEQRGAFKPGAERIARWQALYREELTTIDEQIARLLDHLREKAWERTVVIVTGDHGEEFYEHGKFGHAYNQLFDEGIHVPLIVRLPAMGGKRRVTQQVSSLDLTPTLLALANLRQPERMQGRSLRPLIDGSAVLSQASHCPNTDSPTAYSEMLGHRNSTNSRLSIRTESHKYIHDIDQPHQNQLYDRQSDPGEQLNHYHKQDTLARHFDKLRFAQLVPIVPGGLLTSADGATTAFIGVEPEVAERLRAMGYLA